MSDLKHAFPDNSTECCPSVSTALGSASESLGHIMEYCYLMLSFIRHVAEDKGSPYYEYANSILHELKEVSDG